MVHDDGHREKTCACVFITSSKGSHSMLFLWREGNPQQHACLQRYLSSKPSLAHTQKGSTWNLSLDDLNDEKKRKENAAFPLC